MKKTNITEKLLPIPFPKTPQLRTAALGDPVCCRGPTQPQAALVDGCTYTSGTLAGLSSGEGTDGQKEWHLPASCLSGSCLVPATQGSHLPGSWSHSPEFVPVGSGCAETSSPGPEQCGHTSLPISCLFPLEDSGVQSWPQAPQETTRLELPQTFVPCTLLLLSLELVHVVTEANFLC